MSEAIRSRVDRRCLEFRYYKVDQHGSPVAGEYDLSSYVRSAALTLNADVDVKFQLDLAMEGTSLLDPLVDWVKLVALETIGTAETEWPLGIYRLSTPRETLDSMSQEWALKGYGREIQLVQDKFTEPYTAAAGNNPVDEAVAICVSAGIPASMLNLPTTDHLLPVAMTWEQGIAKLRAVNELLASFGAYSPWADVNGYLTTRVPVALESETPAVTYATGEAGIVEPPAERQQDDTGIANRVVVRVRNADSIYSIVATLADTSHKFHPDNLGYTRTNTYELQTVADVGVAEDYAMRRLEEGLSFYTRSTIRTFLDFGRVGNAFEVYGLDLRDKDGVVLVDGKWRVKGWTMELGTDGGMVHDLRRVEPIGGAIDLSQVFVYMNVQIFEGLSMDDEVAVA
jgi:hypothetical protein